MKKPPNGDESSSKVTATQRYETLCQLREPFLRRARRSSELTIPTLLPPDGMTSSTDLAEPFSSTGAEGVNNLAAKMLMALFPPGQNFVRMKLDPAVEQDLLQRGEQAQGDFSQALARIEDCVQSATDKAGWRAVLFEFMKHIIVAGNGLLFVQNDNRLKLFHLDRFVVKRDLSGTVIDIVVKESVARAALPPKALEVLETIPEFNRNADGSPTEDPNVDLYTWVRRSPNGGQRVHQEVCGHIIPGSQGTYPPGKHAWIPLRWNRVSGEDYGRSHCDDYIGSLRTVEALEKAVTTFAAAAAKVLLLKDPSSDINEAELCDAESGDILEGRADDVKVLQLDKQADFSVAVTVKTAAEKRLERAFLMSSSVQRDAERVTAEEIRMLWMELETTLGGIYALQAEELQRPLVARLIARLQATKKLPHLPDETVEPIILTGQDALGRNSDVQRLRALVGVLTDLGIPDAVTKYLNIGDFLKRMAVALGVEAKGLIREEKEVQAQAQQQQAQQMTEKLGPAAIKAVADQGMNPSTAAMGGQEGQQQ